MTEAVHGLDLVGWQLAIAEGAVLPAVPPPARGHAIEARLYAEDPSAGWAPSAGVLHRFSVPDVDTEFAQTRGATGLRLDSGVRTGDVVGTHYDPMLAKVIANGPDRTTAIRRLVAALRGTRVDGVRTNRELLIGLLTDPVFTGPGADTGWLDRVDPATLVAAPSAAQRGSAALAAALVLAERGRSASLHAHLPTRWRNVNPGLSTTTLRDDGGELVVGHAVARDGLHADVAGLDDAVRLVSVDPVQAVLEIAGVRRVHTVSIHDGQVYVDSPGAGFAFTLVPALPEPSRVLAAGALVAPMPGSVVRVSVELGDDVEGGAELLVLEAMKMEHRVLAQAAGTVTELSVTAGQQVQAGAVLAVVSPATDSQTTDQESEQS